MKKHFVNVGCLEFSGRTITEARFERDRYLEEFFSEDLTPSVVSLPDGTVGVAFRDTHGWAYGVQWVGEAFRCVSGPHKTRRDAEFACRRHLAQHAYKPGSVDTLEILALDDLEGHTQHKSWMRFQEAYAQARAEGLSDDEARRCTVGV